MARQGFSAEKLLEILSENGFSGVQILFGSGAPGGDAGEQDAAPIGSLYLDTSTGHSYKKDANGGSSADWFRDGKLSAGYLAAGGDPTAEDSFETAIGKLDDNLDDLTSTVGVAQGDQHMGLYNGNILTDNQSAKQNIQEISDFIEKNIAEDDSLDGVTSVQVVDDELVDEVHAVSYHVVVMLNSDNARKVSLKLDMVHNGTSSADATAIDDNAYSKLKHGASFNYTLSTGLSGAGASQKMELRVASTEIGGVDIRTRKISQVSA